MDDDIIGNFMVITYADRTTAIYYLGRTEMNLHAAVNLYNADCGTPTTSRSVALQWNAQAKNVNAVTAANLLQRSAQQKFPHVCLGDITVGEDTAGNALSVLRRCSWRGRDYALKKYNPNGFRQLAREVVRVVAIVVDGTDSDAKTVGLVKELASDSLASVLASSLRPPQATILRWLHEAARGVEFAHWGWCTATSNRTTSRRFAMSSSTRWQRCRTLAQ